MKYKIEELYLNEARRIRVEYLKNAKALSELSDYVEVYKKTLMEYISKLEKITESSDVNQVKSEKFFTELEKLNKDVEDASGKMKPFSDNINKLSKEVDRLKDAIVNKYPGITDDEIQSQLFNHISDLY
jgi:uncharacterized coiled-coil DUF342 family protein